MSDDARLNATQAWNTCRSIQWLKSADVYALNTTWERTQWHWSHDGRWHVETRSMDRHRRFRPRIFFTEMHAWNRFLKEHGVQTFQLQHAQVRDHRTRGTGWETRREWQWRAALHLPTRHFGTIIVDQWYVSKSPPGKSLRRQLHQLSQLPSMDVIPSAPTPLHIPGGFFLQAIAPALNHLITSDSKSGSWLRGRRGLQHWLTKRAFHFHGDDEQDRTRPLAFTWIDEVRYQPSQFDRHASSAWKVAFYDVSTGTFFCQKSDSPGVWIRWRPRQPVHRLFNNLLFLNRVHTWIIDQLRVTFPDVVLIDT